jgi:hypothetical protein
MAHDLATDAIRGSTPCAIAARERTPPEADALIAPRRDRNAAAAPQTPPRAEAGIREARQPS